MGEKAPLSEYSTSAKIYSKHHVLETLDYLIDALEKGQRTPFKRIHLEVVFLHIIRSMKKIPLTSLVERLETLKNALPLKVEETLSPSKEVEPPKVEVAQEQSPPSAEEAEAPFFPETPAPIEPSPQSPPQTIQEKIKHEQVMRFASIELNGSLKK